jgi:hypothetical protein
MINITLTFLTILAFFTMQALAEGVCKATSTARAVPTATIAVRNFIYEPNCLTIHDGTFVKWGIFFI